MLLILPGIARGARDLPPPLVDAMPLRSWLRSGGGRVLAKSDAQEEVAGKRSSEAVAAPGDPKGEDAAEEVGHDDGVAAALGTAGDISGGDVGGAEAAESAEGEDLVEDAESSVKEDTAELVMRAEFHSLHDAAEHSPAQFRNYADAVELAVQAISMSGNGPTGVAKTPLGVDWGLCAWVAAAVSATVIILAILLVLARASVRLAAARSGVLVAVGLPAVPGVEPILAVGAAVQQKSLGDVSNMPISSLRNIRDVTLVHRGVWRCLRISRSMRFGESHVWLEAPDGSALRIRGGQAAIRLGPLGSEEPVDLAGASPYQATSEIFGASTVVPSALVDAVATFPA